MDEKESIPEAPSAAVTAKVETADSEKPSSESVQDIPAGGDVEPETNTTQSETDTKLQNHVDHKVSVDMPSSTTKDVDHDVSIDMPSSTTKDVDHVTSVEMPSSTAKDVDHDTSVDMPSSTVKDVDHDMSVDERTSIAKEVDDRVDVTNAVDQAGDKKIGKFLSCSS